MFLNTIDNRQLLLIDSLANIPDIAHRFYLAGGTALALQYGHRTSIDLDMFSQKPFDGGTIADTLVEIGGQIIMEETGAVHAVVNGVKVSFLYYPYPLLKPLKEFHGIPMASTEDIAAMKAVAISQRGDKKDFFDMYEILKTITPADLKKLLLSKFSQARINCYHILKSFFYFDDADRQPDPLSLNGTTWEQVKNYFIEREEELMRGLVY